MKNYKNKKNGKNFFSKHLRNLLETVKIYTRGYLVKESEPS